MRVAIQPHIMVALWHLKQNIRTNRGSNMKYFDENVTSVQANKSLDLKVAGMLPSD